MPENQRNIELKARCRDLTAAARAAADLGATPYEIIRQRDTYFPCVVGRLKLREVWASGTEGPDAAEATPDRYDLIWYRRADAAGPRPSDYRLARHQGDTRLREVLVAALGVRVEVVKRREVLLVDDVRIHLDRVNGLGTFIELEAIVSAATDEEAARDKLHRLSPALGVATEDVVPVSYADLVLAEADGRRAGIQ